MVCDLPSEGWQAVGLNEKLNYPGRTVSQGSYYNTTYPAMRRPCFAVLLETIQLLHLILSFIYSFLTI